MPQKKCNSSELLIRIDERVKALPVIKQDIRDIKDKVYKHETRLSVIEEEHKKLSHNGGLGLVLGIFKLIFRIK